MEALILTIDIALLIVLLRFVVSDKGDRIDQDLGIFQYRENDRQALPGAGEADDA